MVTSKYSLIVIIYPPKLYSLNMLQQALDLAVREFQDNAEAAAQGGGAKSIQWSGLRYMFTEVSQGGVLFGC